MKRRIFYFILLFIIVCESLYGKGFFYEVSGSKGRVFLLGSIHIAKKGAYPLDTLVENCFINCSNFVMEINLSKFNIKEIVDLGIYKDTTKLENVVPIKYLKIIDSLFNLYSIPKFIYNKLKPWVAVLLLSNLEISGNLKDIVPGTEQYLLSKIDSTKNILELESLVEQLEVFQNLYNLNPDLFFEYFLVRRDLSFIQFDDLYSAWESGDEKRLKDIMNEETEGFPLSSEYKNFLIENRNQKMLEKIENFTNQEGCFFVVVGAAHLLGKNGIVELLKQKGYKIKRLI